MSPAVNTPGTLVIHSASRQTLPRSVRRTPSFSSMPGRSGPREAHGEEDQLAGHREFRARHLAEDWSATLTADLEPNRLQPSDLTLLVAEEALRGDSVDALVPSSYRVTLEPSA